ncbi:MAG: hypothetical protein GXX91_02070 [Verrucomicrobiaceae bacterium]|nr:hypothetical protein [Verrucomicrobiaceae bacterium]
MSEQQKLFASLSGALVVHLILLLFVFAFLHIRGASPSSARRGNDPAANETKREVTVLLSELMEQVTVEPAPPSGRSFVSTDLNPPEAVAPENAPYESDRNTSAASPLSPDLSERQEKGPTLRGNGRLPNLTLANRDFREGDAPAKASTQATPTAPADPAAPDDSGAASRTDKGTPEKTAGVPLELSSRSGEDIPQSPAEPDNSVKRESPSGSGEERAATAQMESADEALDSESFQPEEHRTANNGTLTKVGREAVDAVETPLGRYKKQIRDLIAARWHRYRQEHAEAVTWGILKLEFSVDPDGRVQDLHITKNEANSTLVEFSLKAIREATLPPMPTEVANSVGSRGLVIRYDIITY